MFTVESKLRRDTHQIDSTFISSQRIVEHFSVQCLGVFPFSPVCSFLLLMFFFLIHVLFSLPWECMLSWHLFYIHNMAISISCGFDYWYYSFSFDYSLLWIHLLNYGSSESVKQFSFYVYVIHVSASVMSAGMPSFCFFFLLLLKLDGGSQSYLCSSFSMPVKLFQHDLLSFRDSCFVVGHFFVCLGF